jgi:hypothetical protein
MVTGNTPHASITRRDALQTGGGGAMLAVRMLRQHARAIP